MPQRIDFDKFKDALAKACKSRIYVTSPMGSTDFGSYTLSISNEDYLPFDKRRGSLGYIPASKHRSEKDIGGRTSSWHEPLLTARADADLLVLLWNNAAELIRLARLGEAIEKAQKSVKND